MLVELHSMAQSSQCRPSDLIQCDDETAAFLLDRAVWWFGSFVDNLVQRFAYASKSSGKKSEKKAPTWGEQQEFRRALVEGTRYDRTKVRAAKKGSLGKMPGGRRIVQEPGKPMRVE